MASRSARRRRRQNRKKRSQRCNQRRLSQIAMIENRIKAIETARLEGQPLRDSRGRFLSARPLGERVRRLYMKIFSRRPEPAAAA